MEPEFIEQTTIADDDEKIAWFKERARQAILSGGIFFRASYHPDNFDLILFEGWKTWPSDQGEPRWQPSPALQSQNSVLGAKT